jgi:uncharacterized protein (TIGR00730 family)
MAPVMVEVRELARRLAAWSVERGARGGGATRYVVSTGGGPGFMNAANRGASDVPGALSVGMGISLPFEAGLNKYCTPELSWEYHYFFMRKKSMCATCRAFIVCPGGFGTFDELFEILTLMQSGKIELAEHLPVVLLGEAFWRRVVDWRALLEMGVISQSDLHRLYFCDSADAAFAHVTARLSDYEAARAAEAAAAKAAGAAEEEAEVGAGADGAAAGAATGGGPVLAAAPAPANDPSPAPFREAAADLVSPTSSESP